MKKLFTMLSVVCALFAGCSSDDANDGPPKPELTLSSDNAAVGIDADALVATLSADADGISAVIRITTNCESWTMSGQPDWIEIQKTENSLTITVAKNEKVDSRSAELTVSAENPAGKLTATIRVAQTGVAAATLQLAENSLTIPAAGGEATLTYTTNQATVTVEKNDDWLTFTQAEGSIVFKAEANDTAEARSAEVIVTAGAGDNKATDKVVITQDVHASLSLSETEVSIPAAGGEATVTYTTNLPPVTVSNPESWLTVEKNEGGGSVTFSAAVNDTGAPRAAEVTFVVGTDDNTASKTVTVTQDPYVKSFIYVVKTTTDGKEVALPTLKSDDAAIAFKVDYGDGTSDQFDTSLASTMKHAYATAGEYTVTITTDNVISTFQFYYNADLYKILNNTLDMSGVKTLARCFYNDTNLTEVAVNTISPCTAATTAEYLFYGCKALNSVPAGLLNGLTQIKSYAYMFQNCSALTSVPEGFFEGKTAVTTFKNAFMATGLTAIPARLFKGCSSVTHFNYTFHKCQQLETIATDAFEGCTAVEEFYATFTECKALKAIPAGLFKDMTVLNDLEYCFQRCETLTELPAGLFDYNRSLKYFDYCFMGCTQLTGESPYTEIGGNKVHLYERKNYPDDFLVPSSWDGCFSGAELLSDFAAIMQNGWGNN